MEIRPSRRQLSATLREIAAAHLHLDDLFRRAGSALHDASTGDDARRAFDQLREALDVHFAQEDRLYYPPIRALRAGRIPVLAARCEAHERFRRDVATIARKLDLGRVDEAAAGLAALEHAFAQHELREEEMLRGLEHELVPG